MIKIIQDAWRKWMGGPPAQPPVPHKVEFHLSYKSMPVGTLTIENGLWRFVYSEEFKKKSDMRSIVQFPDKECVYESGELWPFFEMRIPSVKQPGIRRIMEEEKIDESDRVRLLERFGRRTISNPFELTTV